MVRIRFRLSTPPARRLPGCLVLAALGLLFGPQAGPVCAQEMVIAPQFAEVGHFYEGVAPALSQEKWGFIDRKGAWVVEPGFDEVMGGSGGRFAVRVGKAWGFIGTRGRMIVEPQFEGVKPFSDGIAAFKKGGKWGYLGVTGKIILEPSYETAGAAFDDVMFVNDSDDGLMLVNSNFNGIYLNTTFGSDKDWVEPLEAGDFSEGIAPVKSDKGWHLIDTKGQIFTPAYRTIGKFSFGRAAATRDGKQWGFVGRNGKFVLQPKYEMAREFAQGFAPVRIKGKWGYIDPAGKVVLEPKYDNAYPVRDGWAIIRVGDKRGFLQLGPSGNLVEIIEAKYDDVFAAKEGLAPVKVGDRWGFIRLQSSGNDQMVREIADLPADAP